MKLVIPYIVCASIDASVIPLLCLCFAASGSHAEVSGLCNHYRLVIHAATESHEWVSGPAGQGPWLMSATYITIEVHADNHGPEAAWV